MFIYLHLPPHPGSTLEAMAAAVEESRCIVICMSSNYKDSASCRTEAEYVFQLRKPYVPLMVEKGYKPDGWLGKLSYFEGRTFLWAKFYTCKIIHLRAAKD